MKRNPKYLKKQLPQVEKQKVSYGHFKLTTTYYNKEVSIITTDTELIDSLSSDDDKEVFKAKLQAIKMIRRSVVKY